jgi:uncharacterized protein (DUF4415 family)
MPAKKRTTRRIWVDPDDAPQWTEEQFDRAEIAVGGEVVRPAQGTLMRPRGRPKKADAKVHLHIRLSPVVLGYFRSTGPGWQTRIDEVLRNWVVRRRKAAPGPRVSRAPHFKRAGL